MSLLEVKTPTRSYTAWSVGFGESLGLMRWDGKSFQAQLGLLAGVFSQFDWSTPSKDLLNTDFTFGVAATHRWHNFRGDFSIITKVPIWAMNFSSTTPSPG